MNFSRLKLNEGIATSSGTQTSLDASSKATENATTSAAERFTRKSVVSAGKARGAAQPQTSIKSGNTVMDSVDHLKNIQKQKEYTRLLESQKSDWRQELTEKAIDGVEREKHPFVTVMPTGDENLIQAVKQMRDGVKEKKSELRTEEAYDKKKDKKKERRGMDGGIDYKKQPQQKSTNKELGIRDFTDKEREERYKEFLKNRKKRLGMKESFVSEDEIVEGYVSVEHGEVYLEGNAGPSTPVKVYIYPDGSKRIQPYMGGTGAVPRKGQASKETKKSTQLAHFELEGEEQLDEAKKKCKDGYKYDKKKKKCVKKKSSSSKSSKTVVYVRGPRYFGGGGHHHHHDDDKPSGGDNNTGGGDTGGTSGDGGVSEMFDVMGQLMFEDLTN